MILPDLNLLLYAVNPHVPQHRAAKAWWEFVLGGDELVGLPHEVTLGFVRIATHPRLGAARVPLAKARAMVDSWHALPNVRELLPQSGHVARVLDLLAQAGASGAVTSDAILAAHAIAHRAVLHTNDSDFARFPGLAWVNPLSGTTGAGATVEESPAGRVGRRKRNRARQTLR